MQQEMFYGWWIVLVCLLVQVASSGTAFYSFSVYQQVLPSAFSTTATAISLATSIYLLSIALTGPSVGRLTDRYGPKRVLLAGGIVAGIGFCLLSVSQTLWELYLFYFVVGLGMSGAGAVATSTAVSSWFVRRRGTAMGITMIGMSIGALTMPNLVRVIMDLSGWRSSFLSLGLVAWALVIPSVAFVMKNHPHEMDLLPDGATGTDQDGPPHTSDVITMTDLKRPSMTFSSTTYWLLSIVFFLANIALSGTLQHEVSFLVNEATIPFGIASLALGLTGGTGALGKLSFGYLSDRISSCNAIILCFGLQALGVGLLVFTRATSIWPFVFVYGFAMGGQYATQPTVVSELFGSASFGTTLGRITPAIALGLAVGPFMTAWIYDTTRSYLEAFIIITILYVVCMVAMTFARKTKFNS
jgi:MFS family permease